MKNDRLGANVLSMKVIPNVDPTLLLPIVMMSLMLH